MKKRFIRLLFTTLFLVFNGAHNILAAHLSMEILVKKFEQLTDQAFQKWGIPGLAIAIVTPEQTVHLKTYGVSKAGNKEKINAHTLFRIASLSKGFSAALSVKLIQKKNFELEDPISNYLPDITICDADLMSQLTIQNILSHTNGIKEYHMENQAYTKHNFQEVIKQLKKAKKQGKVGQHFQYQNVIFNLIKPIIERSTGKTLEEVMQQEILIPLEMHHTFLAEANFKQASNKTEAHHFIHGRYQAVPVTSHYQSIVAAGGIVSSITDMSRWLQALLGGHDAVLTNKQLSTLFSPVVSIPLNAKRFSWFVWSQQRLLSAHYGLGWFVYDYMGHPVIHHSGRLTGYNSLIAFSPEKQIGIVILANSDSLLPAALMGHFFDMLFELPTIHWSEWALKERNQTSKKKKNLHQKVPDALVK